MCLEGGVAVGCACVAVYVCTSLLRDVRKLPLDWAVQKILQRTHGSLTCHFRMTDSLEAGLSSLQPRSEIEAPSTDAEENSREGEPLEKRRRREPEARAPEEEDAAGEAREPGEPEAQVKTRGFHVQHT